MISLDCIENWETTPTSESLSAYFGCMYEWLRDTCKNVVQGDVELADDLAHFTIDWFLQRPSKAASYAGTPLIFSLMLVNFIKTQHRFSFSDIRHNSSTWAAEQRVKTNELYTARCLLEPIEYVEPTFEDPEDIGYLRARFDDEEIAKIKAVRALVHKLPSHLQTVYQDHVENMMSIRNIGKKYGMSTSAAFREVQSMRGHMQQLLRQQSKIA